MSISVLLIFFAYSKGFATENSFFISVKISTSPKIDYRGPKRRSVIISRHYKSDLSCSSEIRFGKASSKCKEHWNWETPAPFKSASIQAEIWTTFEWFLKKNLWKWCAKFSMLHWMWKLILFPVKVERACPIPYTCSIRSSSLCSRLCGCVHGSCLPLRIDVERILWIIILIRSANDSPNPELRI